MVTMMRCMMKTMLMIMLMTMLIVMMRHLLSGISEFGQLASSLDHPWTNRCPPRSRTSKLNRISDYSCAGREIQNLDSFCCLAALFSSQAAWQHHSQAKLLRVSPHLARNVERLDGAGGAGYHLWMTMMMETMMTMITMMTKMMVMMTMMVTTTMMANMLALTVCVGVFGVDAILAVTAATITSLFFWPPPPVFALDELTTFLFGCWQLTVLFVCLLTPSCRWFVFVSLDVVCSCWRDRAAFSRFSMLQQKSYGVNCLFH